MLQQGNRKLGPRIWSWSLPVVETCPGASSACLATCYARRGRLTFGNVKSAHQRNWKLADSDEFAAWMIGEIHRNCVDVLRIHVAGDFFDAPYIAKWRRIIAACRHTQFFAYTRSWTVPELRRPLWRLGQAPNLELWLSADSSMPRPPRWQGCRTCYLMTNAADQPPYPVDLAFRNRPRGVLKRTANGSLICPFENGVTQTTCSHCKLCWRPKRVLRQSTGRRAQAAARHDAQDLPRRQPVQPA